MCCRDDNLWLSSKIDVLIRIKTDADQVPYNAEYRDQNNAKSSDWVLTPSL